MNDLEIIMNDLEIYLFSFFIMDFFVSMVISLTVRSSLYAGALRYEMSIR